MVCFTIGENRDFFRVIQSQIRSVWPVKSSEETCDSIFTLVNPCLTIYSKFFNGAMKT